MGLGGPLEVVLTQALIIRLEHRQLADRLLRPLNLHLDFLCCDALFIIDHCFEFFFGEQ